MAQIWIAGKLLAQSPVNVTKTILVVGETRQALARGLVKQVAGVGDDVEGRNGGVVGGEVWTEKGSPGTGGAKLGEKTLIVGIPEEI